MFIPIFQEKREVPPPGTTCEISEILSEKKRKKRLVVVMSHINSGQKSRVRGHTNEGAGKVLEP